MGTQIVEKQIPKVTTEAVEKIQQVPAVLINEVGLDVPQVQTVEVFKQTAMATSQRIVRTGVQYERAVGREIIERVEQGTMAGIYDAGVVGVRENVSVQPTVVERVSPVMTMGGVVETFAAPTMVETFAAPTVVETFGAPTMIETYGAPTEYVATEMLAAPTVYETIAAPTVMEVVG